MIKRIVKMTFDPQKVADFEAIFNASCHKIRAFKGCQHLELWQDANRANVYFTYSFWNQPQDLENYRQSELFNGVWAETKKLFIAKPEAWSVNQIKLVE